MVDEAPERKSPSGQRTAASRLLGVLLSPSDTFEAIRERPTWALVLVVLLVAQIAVTLVLVPRVDWSDVARTNIEQMRDRGVELSEAQVEQQIEATETFGTTVSYLAPLFGILAYAVTALAIWLMTTLLGGEPGFERSWSLTLHAFMPFVVAAVLTIPVLLVQEEVGAEGLQSGNFLSSSLLVFAPDDLGAVMTAFLGSFDLFSIWTVVLLVIGCRVVAGLSRNAAIGGVIGLWAIWIAVKCGFAALGTMMGG